MIRLSRELLLVSATNHTSGAPPVGARPELTVIIPQKLEKHLSPARWFAWIRRENLTVLHAFGSLCALCEKWFFPDSVLRECINLSYIADEEWI
jgi:hypothetical protein